MCKRTWVEIDLNNIVYNYNLIKSKIGDSMICPVIKDNAYGHGAVMMAKIYEKLKANYFAVSNIEEALELRKNKISTPILILGYTPIDEIELLNKNDITQCVYSLEYARELNDKNIKIKCHLAIDTGMNRIGFKDTLEMYEACLLPNLDFEGVFTHFSDCLDDDYSAFQFNNFTSAIDSLKNKGITFRIAHCANSGTIFKHPYYHLDMVRPGIILYGLDEYEGLKPALTLKSVITHIKDVKKGEAIGYNRRYIADRDIKVATIAIGYGDGYYRYNSGVNTININGKEANILGNVCMDQLMVDVSDIDCKLYDEAIVYGDINKIAKNLNTIPYELICNINNRVPVIYK